MSGCIALHRHKSMSAITDEAIFFRCCELIESLKFIQSPQMNAITQTQKTLDVTFETDTLAQMQSDAQVLLLQGILEGMPDGILIISTTGKLIQSNRLGRYLCDQLIDRPTPVDAVPKSIWRACEALLDSRDTFTDKQSNTFLIEENIQTKGTIAIRVRVQWLSPDSEVLRILVVMEDRLQTARNRAIAEGQRYGLTNRESEVWQYRCIGRTYKQISQKLFITVDTVKKHVKSIHAKRDSFHVFNEEEGNKS